ncbi:MAG: leucine-rich repeat domain-containing protein, partial [Bacteroidales bacterium]|nr:leucine-rich repeat domain-containing protein [Bacteroidales bacterium]
MKTFYKVLFVLAILIANSISASAIEFTVDGVRYSVNNDNTTVTVAGYPSDSEPTGDLTIPESVTYGGISYPVTSIGDGAFNNCIGLTSVTIPNSVTSIGYMAFYWCSGLTSVTIPNSVTSIDDMAFGSCSGLTSVTIPNSVTEIGRGAFSDTAWYNNQPDGLVYAGLVAYKYKGMMPSGTSIVLKEGTKGIADNAFFDCLGLTSVTIPNSVISIGDGAFGECSGLTSVTIPNSVTKIGEGAFSGCSGLTRIDAYPDPEKVSTGADAFYDVPKDGTLHVLPKYLSAYRTTSQWEDFTNIKGDLTEIGGIEVVRVDELDHTLPMNVYNMNGVKMGDRLEDLPAGIYIVRQGSKSA